MDPVACLFCNRDAGRPCDWDDHRLVAVRCQSCGARGPLVVIQDADCREAATALAVELWNRAGRIIDYQEIGPAHIGLTESDKAELDRIAASLKEPATEEPDQHVPAAGDLAPGSTTAECDTEAKGPADAPQVSEAAGGGGGKEANQDTPKAPTVDPEAAARVGARAQGAEQSRPDPASNGAGRGGAAGGKPKAPHRHPIADRIEAYLERNGLTPHSAPLPVSSANLYKILDGDVQPRIATVKKLSRELDKLERDEVRANRPIDPSKVEVLPNRYDELNSGNPLPKHDAPPRCAGTP